MAVFRVERNTGYTVMSNHHLRNKELSLKAKGLLSQMLSLPEDWDYTLAGLSYINRETRNAAIFLPSCYAVGAKRALLHKALRVRFSPGKGLIPKPSKSLFYCVTNM